MTDNRWQYDPASYAVGDDLWVRVPSGWNTYRADRYTVAKKTPSGQIVLSNDSSTLRVSARGRIAGEDHYRGRRPCSAQEAVEVNAEAAIAKAWGVLRDRADSLVHATRQRDMAKVISARDAFGTALSNLPPA